MEPTKGIKTTEWWLSLFAVLLGAFMSSGIVGDEHWAVKAAGLILSALAALGYSAARAKTKAAASLADKQVMTAPAPGAGADPH